MIKKILPFILILPILFIIHCSPAFADPYTINVLGEIHSFDTGSGTDGDVVLRLKPGNPYYAELLVNGLVKATTSNTALIRKNILERNGEPLSSRSDIYVKVFNIEDIVQYLPANRTYDPSNDTPGVGSMPSFNNLTVENGVMLRAAVKPLHFRVRGTLTVNGYLMTEHGPGGAAGSYQKSGEPGGSAKNVIILAGNVNVGNGFNSAIFGGFGGGGGGTGYCGGNGGDGGDGGSVTILCNSLTNTGEIRGGSGGGGGVAWYDWTPGGIGGSGGNVKIVTSAFYNTGKIMSGLKGGNGTRSDSWPYYAGYGAGGQAQYSGGTGGAPGGAWNISAASGAGFGVEGTQSNMYGSKKHGNLRVLVGGSYVNYGKYGVGYSSVNMRWVNLPLGALAEIKTNILLDNYDIGSVLTHFTDDVKYILPNANLILQNFYRDSALLGFVGKNVTVRSTAKSGTGIYVFGDKDVTENVFIEVPFFTNTGWGYIGNIEIGAKNLIRINGSFYRYYESVRINDDWNIEEYNSYSGSPLFSGSPISAYPDSNGMLNLDLTAYSNAYNGQNITFVLLRSEDGGQSWEELMPVNILCATGTSPKLVDLKTKVNKTITYKVKYKKSGNPYGYVMHEVSAQGYTSAAPMAEAKEAALNAQIAASNASVKADEARQFAWQAADWLNAGSSSASAVKDASGTVLQAARQARDAANQALSAVSNIQTTVNNINNTINTQDTLPPSVELDTVSGARATSSSSIQLVVAASDNKSTSLTYSVNGSPYSTLPADGKIMAPLPSTGPNTITVRVKDEAGNTAVKTIKIWRLS
ncbi:MAG: hypothetical protein K6U74_06360 [Firmicutes bacterium]|nr:hypothetical protein [Bacillota bacterium]